MTLILPFRPFTIGEVQVITGAEPRTLDYWTKTVLPLVIGDDGVTRGWNYSQAFAAFVGNRYLHEGADFERANPIVEFLSHCSMEFLEFEFEQGRTFALGKDQLRRAGFTKGVGMFIALPKDKPVAARLDCAKLLSEFQASLRRVFPEVRS